MKDKNYEFELVKAQNLLTDLRYWISHGQSEHSVRKIDEYWRDWQGKVDSSTLQQNG